MRAGLIVFLLILPRSSAACCEENHQKKTKGVRRDLIHERYQTLTGQIFMVPCLNDTEQIWSKTGGGTDGRDNTSFGCGKQLRAEEKHSGMYTCVTCGSKPPSFYLQVVDGSSQKCSGAEHSRQILHVGAGGEIPCPGVECNNNTNVTWYKVKEKALRAVSEQRRESCEQEGFLRLCKVDALDTGIFFCDRRKREGGVSWIVRRSVHVTAIRQCKPICHPTIVHPEDNSTQEVELGRSYTLHCRANFPFEVDFAAEMQWYASLDGNPDDRTPIEKQETKQGTFETAKEIRVTQAAVIEEVTPQHLESSYTCFARNPFGNRSITIRLKKKNTVTWPSLIPCPVVLVLLAAGLALTARAKRLELRLIFRSYFQSGKYNTDKDFDVLLSCLWSPASQTDEAHGSKDAWAGQNQEISAECWHSLTPLEALLPQVVEEQWWYRLCVLERDLLPGGAYTSDIVLAIQRSQMLVCVLSADYLADSNAVFVLEAGVQALLKNPGFKLLLIWTDSSSACQCGIKTSLPILVRRALKVLPSLEWKWGEPVRGTKHFWRSLHKAMPRHKVQLSGMKGQRREDCTAMAC